MKNQEELAYTQNQHSRPSKAKYSSLTSSKNGYKSLVSQEDEISNSVYKHDIQKYQKSGLNRQNLEQIQLHKHKSNGGVYGGSQTNPINSAVNLAKIEKQLAERNKRFKVIISHADEYISQKAAIVGNLNKLNSKF